jgi:predicted ABC-type transport system involved in lysophospholipase L1 biosynthesis ATPase subunit
MPTLRVSGLGRTIRRDDGDLAVLQGADLAVEPGEAVGVTGPLDSGWRSLLRLIVGLDPATEGTVALDGPAREREELRQEVVLASALDPLLDRGLAAAVTGVARLATSRRRGVRRATGDAIAAAAGVRTAAGPWSRGERLRLCVALASSLAPAHLLLAVEPPLETAEDRSRLAELLARTREAGCGLVLGTRDELLLAAAVSRVLIFQDGEVLAEGTPESVLTAAWRRARQGGGA